MRLLRTLALVLAASVALAGCRLGAPPPAPPEEFQEFSVGLFGGVAGLQTVLRVRTDGVAVLASARPTSGRIDPDKLIRVQRLLLSEQFRREVTATNDRPPGSDRCSDLFIREVTMGSLSVRKTDRCGNEQRPDTPAFDEIVATLSEELDGRIDGPVDPPAEPPAAMQLTRAPRTGAPGYVITVDESGQAVRHGPTTESGQATVSEDDLRTLRLLGEVVAEAAPRSCPQPGPYELIIRSSPPLTGTSCTLQQRSPQFWAIVRLLEDQFG